MQVRGKFVEFSEDKGSVEKVLTATKLPEGGNSHSTYSPYHLEDKVNFDGVGNATTWAADVRRRKNVKCYVQGSGWRKKVLCHVQGRGRRKRKKSVGCGSERRDNALMGALVFALYNPGRGVAEEWFRWMSCNGLITTWDRFVESVKNRFGPSKYEDPRGALSMLLHLGTVEDNQREFENLMNRITDIPDSLLTPFYISGLKPHLQRELLASKPMTLGYVFLLARIIEARFEVSAEKEQNIKEKVDTPLSMQSEEASPVVKGPLDASEDTLLSWRSEDPNFKIQENMVEYVRALNVAPLEVVFAGPVDEVSSVIDDVFDIGESNVESMQVRGKFTKFSEDRGSVEKVLSATKLPEGGNSHSEYSPYHLEGKVNFEGVGNVTACSGRMKRKKSVGYGSERRDCALMGASIFALYNPGPGSFAQGRIWDPRIKNAFQNNTLGVLIMATLRSISRLCNRISSTKFNTKSFDSSSFIKATLNPKNCSSSRTTSRYFNAFMTHLARFLDR
uniref:Uncharacterized protein n=1 Tax=Tanacetum cinerariifolium TaxID=118510 RepID=A0A6L2L9U2_TANCI|nr:hypothetical protein [Tanacetum cinerariifolium]